MPIASRRAGCWCGLLQFVERALAGHAPAREDQRIDRIADEGGDDDQRKTDAAAADHDQQHGAGFQQRRHDREHLTLSRKPIPAVPFFQVADHRAGWPSCCIAYTDAQNYKITKTV
ncbi:MAG: hypothetical protein ACRET1_06350 [Burkholderiales bacterium]